MKRLSLCHSPTPIWRHRALDALVGCELWVKRDDMTAGAAAGNKIRKLEYLFADALANGATAVITCGALQSNHARATALVARELGLTPHLLLRTAEPARPGPAVGNLLLDRLVGAELRLITPRQYRERAELMNQLAEELTARGEVPYVIPEGGSNGVGAFGYVTAVEELAEQQARAELPADLDAVVFACGSGGTAAGVALGLGRFPGVAARAVAMAVCDDRAYFEQAIGQIVAEARALDPSLGVPAPFDIYDTFKGPAYGVASPEQLGFVAEVARACGLVLDLSYTGKALFVHTGGLPGLLAESEAIAAAWEPAAGRP